MTTVSSASPSGVECVDDPSDGVVDQRVLGGDVGAGRLVVVDSYGPPEVVEGAGEGVLLGRVQVEVEGCRHGSDEPVIDGRERPEGSPGEPFVERVAGVGADDGRGQDVRAVVVHRQEERSVPGHVR